MMSAGKCWQSSQKPPEQIKMRGRDSSRQAGEESAAQLQHRQSKRAKNQKNITPPQSSSATAPSHHHSSIPSTPSQPSHTPGKLPSIL